MKMQKLIAWVAVFSLLAGTVAAFSVSAAAPAVPALRPAPQWATAAGFDVSPPLRDLAARPFARSADSELYLPDERGPLVKDQGFAGDGAL
jgi:hypothetical protein